MEDLTFNQFCYKYCDGLYDPRFSEEDQCTGYYQLKKMVIEGIEPASAREMARWKNKPTLEEIISEPDIKYLRFLHPMLRLIIINQWEFIKNLKV